jgi:biopolymer transport protein ExbB
MFLNADIVVKAVMIGLVFASVVTWAVFIAKALQIAVARREARAGRIALRNARSLDEAERHIDATGAVDDLIREAGVELDLSHAMPADGIKERVASRLERVEVAASRRMSAGVGILATIGATAPFVGLFGTVWGIMNSFIGISEAQTTNLAIVAPGIAEALLATGIGLVAAIPAVVIYNVFSRWVSGYRAELADSSAEILRLVGRDLDRQYDHYAQAAQ